MSAKATSGKAEARHALADLFPGAFTRDKIGKYVPEAQCIDVLQLLHGFVRRGCRPGTGLQLLQSMKHRAETTLRNGCKVVVFCFDRIEDVPSTKGQEQAKRDEVKAEKRRDQDLFEHPEWAEDKSWKDLVPPYFALQRRMPYDLEDSLSDREGFLVALVRWICYQWVACPEPEGRLSVPEGAEVIISGHRLTTGDAKKLGLATDQREHPLKNYNFHVSSDSIGILPDDYHFIGEAETQFCYFAAHLEEKVIEFVSTDTDVLYLSLIMKDRFPEKHFAWTYERKGDDEERMNAGAFLVALGTGTFDPRHIPKRKTKPFKPPNRSFRDAKDLLWCLIAAGYAAGSDYTDGYHGTTHRTFFEALFGYFDAVGDLVVDDELQGGAYARLVATTYVLTKFPTLDVKSPMVAVREKSAHYLEKSKLPRDEIIAERCMQLAHHFELLKQAGTRKLEVPPPLAYGFHLVDPEKEPGRENISRQRREDE